MTLDLILGQLLFIETLMIIGVLCFVFVLARQIRLLKEKNKFLELVFDTVPEVIFVKDEEFRFVEINKKFLSLYPRDKQDKIIGKTLIDDFTDDEVDLFLSEDRKAFKKGFSKTTETVTLPDGVTRTFETKKVRFYNDNEDPYILGIAKDITELTHLIHETERSQSMFRMIMDFFPGYVFVKDENSIILYANQKFVDMYPSEKQNKIIGHTTFEDYPEHIRDSLIQHDKKTLRDGDVTEKKYLEFPNGTAINATIRKTCFTDPQGNDYILCLITDDDAVQTGVQK